MHRICVAFAVVVLSGCVAPNPIGPTSPEQDAVMSQVHQFIDGFNANDIEKAKSSCTDDLCILDEFAPFEWHGAGAFMRWVGDFGIDAKNNAITAGHVTLGAARHIDVVADRAYVVAAVDYTFAMKGKPQTESGSTLTVALRKGSEGWRITGWAWSKG